MKFLDFEGSALPTNNAGATYPSVYSGESGGTGTVSLVPGDPEFGKSVALTVTSGVMYAQFNAHNASGTRGFAREYVSNPAAWKFNTYNRLVFWIKRVPTAAPLATGGQGNLIVGTYVKRVANADRNSDETGGGHYYHKFNVPNTNTWTKIEMNMHPFHDRGAGGNVEHGDQPHPTGEDAYNYFDALTRFYVNEMEDVGSVPVLYKLDAFEFLSEASRENDDQVYGIAATYVPGTNEVYLTWSRRKDDNTTKHEVRFSNRDIHQIGWNAATPAPNGIVTPKGSGGYNGMTYVSSALPTTGTLYLAIKPQGSTLFSQIELPTRNATSISPVLGEAGPRENVKIVAPGMEIGPFGAKGWDFNGRTRIVIPRNQGAGKAQRASTPLITAP